jgi:hypothetical protein
MKFFLSAFLTLVFAVLGPPSHGLATIITCTADLNGLNESSPNTSPGTGFARVVFDDAAHTLEVHLTFSGLVAPNTAAHIHGVTAVPRTGNAGVMTTTPTFPSFPSGVTSGTYDHTLDLTLPSSWNPAFVTANGGVAGAEAALGAALPAGRTYFNIHSSPFPGGEIRGFLVPVPAMPPYLLLLLDN